MAVRTQFRDPEPGTCSWSNTIPTATLNGANGTKLRPTLCRKRSPSTPMPAPTSLVGLRVKPHFTVTTGRITVVGLSQPVQTPPDYPDDSFVAKYDSSGNLKWVNDIGGYKAITTDIAISSDGKVSLTGFIGNIGSGTTLQGETIVTSQPPGSNINLGGGQFTDPYNKDALIATYDANGVLLEASRIGAAKNDGGSGIAYDQAGNLYLSGVFAGTINVAGHLLRGTKTHNLFVLKYGTDALVWAKKANGAGTDQFESGNPRLSVIPGGGVLVPGGNLDTPVFGDISLQGAGAEDIFLALLGQGFGEFGT